MIMQKKENINLQVFGDKVIGKKKKKKKILKKYEKKRKYNK